MALPWVRFDTNTPAHDKILALVVSEPSPKRWQAAASWHFSIEWSGGAGTDGVIPRAALPWVHGNEATARLLVKHKLWSETAAGWRIRNFEKYQLLHEYAEAKEEMRRYASAKANCNRWHGKACWTEGKGCSRDQ